MKVLIIICGIIGLIHLGEGLILGRRVHFKEVEVESSKIIGELEGYKIVFVTDIHKTSTKKLEKLVTEIEEQNPDLILLGGDFGGGNWTKNAVRLLAGIQTTDGIYGVQGNHDNASRLFSVMEENGVGILDNEGIDLRPGLFIGGVADFWFREASIEKAMEKALIDDFQLLVCHNADLTMEQSTEGIDLVLSGHTHGGEITFFGIWAPALTTLPKRIGVTKYKQRFMSGWSSSAAGTDVYISKGVGNYLGTRIFAQPEITVLTLTSVNV